MSNIVSDCTEEGPTWRLRHEGFKNLAWRCWKVTTSQGYIKAKFVTAFWRVTPVKPGKILKCNWFCSICVTVTYIYLFVMSLYVYIPREMV